MNTIRGVDVKGKRVLVRCDFNVPQDEQAQGMTDDFRITQSLPTIRYLISQGAKLFLISHFLKLDPIQQCLERYLGQPVLKISDYATKKIPEGNVCLLENIRFDSGEEANDEKFAKKLALLGDIYVNDAFSASHRSHASIVKLPTFLPAFTGFLLEEEVRQLERFCKNPKRPFIAIVGGKKAQDKLSFLNAMSEKADYVLLGNVVAEELTKENIALRNPKKVILPLDGYPGNGNNFDIGFDTRKLFQKKLENAESVFWTGPLGWVEKKEYADGSLEVAASIIKSNAFSFAGGGDMAAFLKAYHLRDAFSYVSTGGGASLAFLSGQRLPGLEVLGYYHGSH